MVRCSRCEKEPSGLVSNATHCEHCGAALESPAQPVTFKCYICGKPFPSDPASSERRCEACRAVYPTEPGGTASAEDGVAKARLVRAGKAFATGLFASPVAAVAVLVFTAMPAVSIVLIIVGGAIGSALYRKDQRRREPVLESLAGLAGAAVSLWLTVKVYGWFGR